MPTKFSSDVVQYPPQRLAELGQLAAAENSPFSLSDRIGLVADALALSKAGYSTVSSALQLISTLRDEKERETDVYLRVNDLCG